MNKRPSVLFTNLRGDKQFFADHLGATPIHNAQVEQHTPLSPLRLPIVDERCFCMAITNFSLTSTYRNPPASLSCSLNPSPRSSPDSVFLPDGTGPSYNPLLYQDVKLSNLRLSLKERRKISTGGLYQALVIFLIATSLLT
ncbi:hypothetical protein M8C21_007026 [Ambrosia artemisiifolia]|uniref:Uncharacterized protein n=1 Tax=Ambrosia artemisiifolia TaxID=4212 RepID=A0AAD5G3R6_AMBAR|nr:hypothetical protein M8C21_007026 [Ambrosia artemisiifolia]